MPRWIWEAMMTTRVPDGLWHTALDPVWHTWDMTRPLGTKRPRDLNELAAALVNEAVSEDISAPADDGKDPAAVALGRKGGLKGGKARAAALSPERRKEIAQKAAATRWGTGEASRDERSS